MASVAEAFYGNRHYELVLAKLNKLKDGAPVPAGTQVRTPDLKEMLLTEGLPKSLAPQLARVAKARYGFVKIHEDLERALHPGNSDAKVHMPYALAKGLKRDAAALEAAAKELAKRGNFSNSATRMRQRLDAAALLMRQMAAGSGAADAEDQVHLLFAQAFVRGLMWARNEDGDIKEMP